jgi:hypothetical protein
MPRVSPRPTRGSFRLLAVLVGVVVACLMIEVATRVLVRMDTGSSFEFRIPHPVLGWTLEPGASYKNRIPEAEVFVAYNSSGWRDVEHERAKPAGAERYLVLGDSFMEAYSVQLDESFHRQVETLARSRGAEVETINMGVGGYGTLQAYLTYDREGRLYEPDVVLLGFYMANDLRNNSRELESALGQKALKVTSRPFLDPDSPEWQITPIDYEGAMRRFERARPRTRGTLHRLGQHSRFIRLLADWADRPARADDRGEPVDPDRRRLALSGVHDCVQDPAYDRSWKLTRRIFQKFKADVERDGLPARSARLPPPGLDARRARHSVDRSLAGVSRAGASRAVLEQRRALEPGGPCPCGPYGSGAAGGPVLGAVSQAPGSWSS